MKNKTLLAAGIMALLVTGIFCGLIYFVGPITINASTEEVKSSSESKEVKFVPPLERIRKEREENAPKGRVHTKMTPPKTKIFQTLYKEGTQVTFNHEEHVETYGLGCIECHHVESCERCHTINTRRDVVITTGKQALHENCVVCHSEVGGPVNCDECHKQ